MFISLVLELENKKNPIDRVANLFTIILVRYYKKMGNAKKTKIFREWPMS